LANIRWRCLLILILGVGLYPQSTGNQLIVNTTQEGEQTAPAMAVDSSGNHIVVWISTPQDDGIAGIYARRFDPSGIPAIEEFQVNTYWGPHDHPDVAMGSLGNFVVVSENYWIEGPVSSAVIARVFDLSGESLGPEFMVNQRTDDFQGAPVVGIDSLGRFVVAWQSWGQDGDGFGIYARLFDSLGNPLGTEFRVNTYISGDQIQPAVAMEETGEFVVVWTSSAQDGDQSGVYAQRFDRTGAPLGQEFQVNVSSLARQEHPDVSKDALGNYVVCWQRYAFNQEGYAVYARTFDQTAQLKGPEFQVHEPSPGWQVFPSVDCDILGNFLIAWQDRSEDGIGFDVMARTFDSNGQAQGPAFRVNAVGAGRQYTPATIMLGLTDYFISWQSRAAGVVEWDIAYRPYRSPSARASDARRRLIRNHENKKIKHCPGSIPAGSSGTGL
jgi:hypothetical protein